MKIDVGNADPLVGENLLIGLYANELLIRLLAKFETMPTLFAVYQQLLLSLSTQTEVIVALRNFELTLLSELGYGISFDLDALNGEAIKADVYYRYVANEGFHPMAHDTSNAVYKGEHLLAIAAGKLTGDAQAVCARNIIRVSINALLAGKPLKSRELFQQYQADVKR